MKYSMLALLALMFVACGNCNKAQSANYTSSLSVEEKCDVVEVKQYVDREETDRLIILYPNFSRVDLVCESMPWVEDKDVILTVAAAFTGERLNYFKHKNIAGDHVSGGVRYDGYKCARNSGAFVYYNGQWKFCYKNYSHELGLAASNGGAGFGQELIMIDGEFVPTTRQDANINCFRALCEKDERLCVIESKSAIAFGEFKKLLKELGVSHAIYIDMGSGWNHAWYRADDNNVVTLKPVGNDSKYCTNWITFYR